MFQISYKFIYKGKETGFFGILVVSWKQLSTNIHVWALDENSIAM